MKYLLQLIRDYRYTTVGTLTLLLCLLTASCEKEAVAPDDSLPSEPPTVERPPAPPAVVPYTDWQLTQHAIADHSDSSVWEANNAKLLRSMQSSAAMLSLGLNDADQFPLERLGLYVDSLQLGCFEPLNEPKFGISTRNTPSISLLSFTERGEHGGPAWQVDSLNFPSSFCITRISEGRDTVQGTFNLALTVIDWTSDGLPRYPRHPARFTLTNGRFQAVAERR